MSIPATLREQLAADAELRALLAQAGRELTDAELERVAAGKQIGEGIGRVGAGIGTGIGTGLNRIFGNRNT
jgi:hypothetical protein